MDMIQITAYLRTEEDLALWKALENKTEFLHAALNKKTTEHPLAKVPGPSNGVYKKSPEYKNTNNWGA